MAINHVVVTYGRTKKGLSYFYPKQQVQADRIPTNDTPFLSSLSFISHLVPFVKFGKLYVRHLTRQNSEAKYSLLVNYFNSHPLLA